MLQLADGDDGGDEAPAHKGGRIRRRELVAKRHGHIGHLSSGRQRSFEDDGSTRDGPRRSGTPPRSSSYKEESGGSVGKEAPFRSGDQPRAPSPANHGPPEGHVPRGAGRRRSSGGHKPLDLSELQKPPPAVDSRPEPGHHQLRAERSRRTLSTSPPVVTPARSPEPARLVNSFSAAPATPRDERDNWGEQQPQRRTRRSRRSRSAVQDVDDGDSLW